MTVTITLSSDDTEVLALACYATARAWAGSDESRRLLDIGTHIVAALRVAGVIPNEELPT